MAWAEDWIATCFELQADRPPSPGEREAIHRAMLLLRSANDRTLTHFVAQVQDETIRLGAALLHAGRHARPSARCRARTA